MFDIVIIGAGGFGREVYLWAKSTFTSNEYKIKGFLAKNPGELDGFNISSAILGNEETYTVQESDRFLMAIGNVDIKKNVVTRLKAKGAKFLTLIHPTAIVADTAQIGEGVVICPFATVSDHVVLDDFVMMNLYSSCGHDVKVGKYCILSPYATINGFGVLKDEVFLGTHSTVTPYKKIGRKAKVCANSVAMHDVCDGAFLYGVPGVARVIFKK